MEKQIGIEYPDGCGFPAGKICMKCAIEWEEKHAGEYDTDSGKSTTGIFEGEIFTCTLCGKSSGKESAIIIRNVPESLRREFKARCAQEGISQQGKIIELMANYTK